MGIEKGREIVLNRYPKLSVYAHNTLNTEAATRSGRPCTVAAGAARVPRRLVLSVCIASVLRHRLRLPSTSAALSRVSYRLSAATSLASGLSRHISAV